MTQLGSPIPASRIMIFTRLTALNKEIIYLGNFPRKIKADKEGKQSRHVVKVEGAGRLIMSLAHWFSLAGSLPPFFREIAPLAVVFGPAGWSDDVGTRHHISSFFY